MISCINFDMDGVLCDFIYGLRRVPEIYDRYKAQLDSADPYTHISLENDVFSNILPGLDFNWWEELPWIEETKILWNALKHLNPRIISSPAESDPTCRPGKLNWVKKNLGDYTLIFEHTKKKGAHCRGSNSILFDDNPDAIKSWIDAGGIGFLYRGLNSVEPDLKNLGML